MGKDFGRFLGRRAVQCIYIFGRRRSGPGRRIPMNILFAGPWDLVGKTTAEHFLREGHDVCWLTEEPKRKK